MKINILILSIVLSLIACKEKQQEIIYHSNLVSEFETELQTLNKTQISSIDSATSMFKSYINRSTNFKQKDSLFQPYFDYYNLGQNLLKDNKPHEIEKYGFSKKFEDGKEFLVPTNSMYLNDNIITYLSRPMQQFCQQQLKEFNELDTIKIVAKNTLWWENFNNKNPNFFLKEMTVYHYKNWHLKNLISGTNSIPIFDSNKNLRVEARKAYENIVNDHPDTETATIIREYLSILEKSNFKRTNTVEEFISRLK